MGWNLMIVDDSKTSRTSLAMILQGQKDIGMVHEASDGAEALRILASSKVDLILSDVVMPSMDGYKLAQSMQDHREWSHIPIILLTSRSAQEEKVKGLELGAWDYLCKPADPVELITRIRVMLRIKKLQDKLKQRIHQLERLSIVDSLTGLYNKKYLYEFAKREIKRSDRLGLSASCIMMDIDHFKKINDKFGHPLADQILSELGTLLGDIVRGYDFAARYGGDEFTILLPQQHRPEDSRSTSERIRSSIEGHEFTGKTGDKVYKIRITVSLGVATYPGTNIRDYETLIEKADEALYQAKLSGRNRTIAMIG
jgi:two-component system, cell cycle response regulator